MNLAVKYQESLTMVLHSYNYDTRNEQSFKGLLALIDREMKRLRFNQEPCNATIENLGEEIPLKAIVYENAATLIYDILPMAAQGSQGTIRIFKDHIEFLLRFRPGFEEHQETRLFRFRKL